MYNLSMEIGDAYFSNTVMLINVYDVTWSYSHDDIANGTFNMADDDPQLNLALVPWAIVKIVCTGLPDWIGVIVDREWDNGGVKLTLKSAERLLKGKVCSHTIGSAGVVTTIGRFMGNMARVALSNHQDPLVLGVSDASSPCAAVAHYEILFNYLQAKSKLYVFSFWVDGNLKLNVRDRRGTDYLNVPIVLREGRDLVNCKWKENFEAQVTAVIAVGGTGNVDTQLLVGRQIIIAGTFQAAKIDFSGVQDLTTLISLADGYLRQNYQQSHDLICEAVNNFGAWAYCDIGNTLEIVLIAGPYKNNPTPIRVKIIAMDAQHGGTLKLTLQVLTDILTAPIVSWNP